VTPSPGHSDPEVVSLATAGALLSGGLAVVATYLAALTGALAALTLAGWLGGHADLRAWQGRHALAVGAVALGAGAYLLGPSSLLGLRAILLAVSVVPLWLTRSA
jgi:hypothetical protein